MALALGSVLLLCFGLNACAQSNGPTTIEEEMAQVNKIAVEKYPDLPIEEARLLVARERNQSRMMKHGIDNQQVLAAVSFYTFYRANTSIRSNYCSGVGVDVSPFVAAFRKEHAIELLKADSIFRESGNDFDEDWRALRTAAEVVMNDSMRQLASQRQTDAAGACSLFADNPDEVTMLLRYEDMYPEDHKILLSHEAEG